MQSLKDTSISPIKSVPGLFLSDRFAARSVSLLKSYNIGYVLSVVRPDDLPNFSASDPSEADAFASEVVTKHIDINDDPTEDILCHLRDACDFIDGGLFSQSAGGDSSKQVGVLVHCTQGISRSASIVIAYLMRTFSLKYSSALSMAWECRPLVCPNAGFERQLRIWEFCEYDVYVRERESTLSPGSAPKEKTAYKVWKAERDDLLSRGEEATNKARFLSMASMAAEFGKRRLKTNKNINNKEGEETTESEEEKQRRKSWERVENMEKDWNRKLIAGDVLSETQSKHI
ncbi:phosphatases II [Glonium stellatum]|uniref:protein-tyrosine-phosphatase n=1 Tax=Glonium stellatum TaxID=574774 RepID=A0A8E2EPK0_9PEZI|nr:phosphatases II [Glonium stellatum]